MSFDTANCEWKDALIGKKKVVSVTGYIYASSFLVSSLALCKLVQGEQFGQLHVLVLLVGHLDVRLDEDSVRLEGRLRRPHVEESAHKLDWCVVDGHDRATALLLGRVVEAVSRHLAQAEKGLKLSLRGARTRR